jgi:hypothetical protein
MLEDIVTSVLRRFGDIRIERGSGRGDLLAAAEAVGARIVVIACSNPADLATADRRLATAAGLVVLALARNGGSACLHLVASAAQPLDDVSPDGVLAALTAALPASGRG